MSVVGEGTPHMSQVLVRAVSGRPIRPESTKEVHVIGRYEFLRPRLLEGEEVEEVLELLVVAKQDIVQSGGRHRQRHETCPSVGRRGRCRIRSLGTPIMPDEHGTVVPVEYL